MWRECYNDATVLQHNRYGEVSVMVWGWISIEGRTDPVVKMTLLCGHLDFKYSQTDNYDSKITVDP